MDNLDAASLETMYKMHEATAENLSRLH